MKKIISTLVALSFVTSAATAQTGSVNQTKERSNICRGEFSDNIVASIKDCSEDELSRSLYEISVLERDLAENKDKLNKLLSTRGANGVSHNQAEIIFCTSIFAAIFGTAGSLASLGTLSEFGDLRYVKGFTAASLVSFAMGVAGLYFGHKEMKRLEVQFSDVPLLRAFIEKLEAQIKIRKGILELAGKIKKEQK